MVNELSKNVEGGLKGGKNIAKNVASIGVNVAQGNNPLIMNDDCFDDFLNTDSKKPFDFEVSKKSAQIMYF